MERFKNGFTRDVAFKSGIARRGRHNEIYFSMLCFFVRKHPFIKHPYVGDEGSSTRGSF